VNSINVGSIYSINLVCLDLKWEPISKYKLRIITFASDDNCDSNELQTRITP